MSAGDEVNNTTDHNSVYFRLFWHMCLHSIRPIPRACFPRVSENDLANGGSDGSGGECGRGIDGSRGSDGGGYGSYCGLGSDAAGGDCGLGNHAVSRCRRHNLQGKFRSRAMNGALN